MGSGTTVELDHASSGPAPEHPGAPSRFWRRLRLAVHSFTHSTQVVHAHQQGSSASSNGDSNGQWESAIDNPEAQAFLKGAVERRKQMQEEGLIHGP
jgi:hypothetical protein